MMNSFIKNGRSGYINTWGWGLSFFIPISLYFTLTFYNVNSALITFLSLLSFAIVMWVLKLVPEYLPGLLFIISCAALGPVPGKVALSGFFSETVVMIFSILAMTILIARSNLIPRLMLFLFKLIPKKPFFFDSVFFSSFSILSPMIPSIVSRTHLVGKTSIASLDMFGVRSHEGCTTGTIVSAFFGASLFSNIFLSASLMNFVILSLLPAQEQAQFQFLGWMKGSFVAFITMLILYFVGYQILQLVFYRDRLLVTAEEGKLVEIHSQKVVEEKIKALGKISKDEWFSLGTLLAFFASMIILPDYHISPTWGAFGIICVLRIFNVLSWEDLTLKIDWKFLLYIVSIIGISSTMKYLDISSITYEKLQTFTNIFEGQPQNLFIFFVVFTLIVRLFLPIGATIALLAPMFITLSHLHGITAWAACFTCLIVSDIWFFKYQCIFYSPMTDVLEKGGITSFNERVFFTYNMLFNIVRILGIIASYYYWRRIGLCT